MTVKQSAENAIFDYPKNTSNNPKMQETANLFKNVRHTRGTVSLLLSDSVLSYSAGADDFVSTGDKVQGGVYLYDVAASGATDQHLTTAGGVKLYVQPDGEGGMNIEAHGGLADGSVGALPAMQAARGSAILTGRPITGSGVFLLDDQFDNLGANIYMPNGWLRLADAFPVVTDGAAIKCTRPADNPFFPESSSAKTFSQLVLKVDGNKDNQTNATIAVRLENVSGSAGTHQFRFRDTYTGIQAFGEIEKMFISVGGYNCTLLVHDLFDPGAGTPTPDELHWTIQADHCDQNYKQEGNASSVVDIVSEQSGFSDASAWAIEILGDKSCTVRGILRALQGKGVRVAPSGTNLNMSFDDLIIYAANVGEALEVVAARNLRGSIRIDGADGDDVVKIGAVTGGILNLSVQDAVPDTVGNPIVRIGDTTGPNQCQRMLINLECTAPATHTALFVENANNTDFRCGLIAGIIELASGSQDCSMSLQAKFIEDNETITDNRSSQWPIEFRGRQSLTQLQAFSSGAEGMRALCVSSFEHSAAIFVNTGWIPSEVMERFTTAELTDIADRANTEGKYIGRQVYDETSDKVIYAAGTNDAGLWKDGTGATVITPV